MKVNVAESHIISAIKNPKYTPIHFAISRAFNVGLDDIDLMNDRLYIWTDDEEDHKIYDIVDLDEVNYFMDEWNFFVTDGEEFLEEPFDFVLKEHKLCSN
jgi:hypothetical protein